MGDGRIPLPCPSICKGKTVIGTTLSTAKAKLALTQEEFGYGFHTIQDGLVKSLVGVLRRALPQKLLQMIWLPFL